MTWDFISNPCIEPDYTWYFFSLMNVGIVKGFEIPRGLG